jgi:[acyl-carrier-protein] S-malonyltransferase
MAEKVAFLFPGQGSQFVGMGRDLSEAFPQARRVFERVDEICQRPISRLCFEGPMETLTLTENLQPAIAAVSLGCLDTLKASGFRPAVSAGHSLGEYAALAAAEVICSDDALRLVQKRGELMHREALANPGAMAAVVGLDLQTVEEVVAIAKEDEVLAVANHNTADQVVITGQERAVSRAVQLLKGRGGKAIPLKVSGAWHSPLMGGAVEEFRRFMDRVHFSRPELPVLLNATVDTATDPEHIKDIMARQLTSPVRWYEIVRKILSQGITTFVEIGPKRVLNGLAKKIASSETVLKLYNLEDQASMRAFMDHPPLSATIV